MPRTKLDPKPPPIDWLKAAVMERKRMMGFTWDDLAECCTSQTSKTKFSGGYIRKLVATKDCTDWPSYIIKPILKKLGIDAKLVLSDSFKEVHL